MSAVEVGGTIRLVAGGQVLGCGVGVAGIHSEVCCMYPGLDSIWMFLVVSRVWGFYGLGIGGCAAHSP